MTGQHNSFATKLKAAREARGLSQTELAREVELSRGRIGQLESGNGKHGYPRIPVLIKIGAVLEVPTDEVFGWIVEDQGNDLRSAGSLLPGYVSRLTSNRRPVASLLTFPGRPATVRTSVAVSA